MDALTDAARLAAEIRNAAWMVRHYRRGKRNSIGSLERGQAIQRLGLTVRHAFNSSEDFEALLTALVEGLAPVEYDKPF